MRTLFLISLSVFAIACDQADDGTFGTVSDMGTAADSCTCEPAADGIDGAPGAPGADGAPGAPGAPGALGETGPAGAQGSQGATGSQGPQGPAGAQGEQGPPGPTGATGVQGPVGEIGPTGADGTDGEDGIPRSKSDLYTGYLSTPATTGQLIHVEALCDDVDDVVIGGGCSIESPNFHWYRSRPFSPGAIGVLSGWECRGFMAGVTSTLTAHVTCIDVD